MPLQIRRHAAQSILNGNVIMSTEDRSGPRAAILYATDSGFAMPTIASALQMRLLCPVGVADIRIVTNGMSDDLFLKLRDYLAPKDIFVDSMPASMFLDFNRELSHKSHIPPSALARFFLLDCVPDHYDRILYLDGDTWPMENPSELFTAPLPPNMFAAADDALYYRLSEKSWTATWAKNYFSSIGINGKDGYFNSGVLLADTVTWRKLSLDAYRFFQANTAHCVYFDQSALNAVAAGRRLRLAPRWNFMSEYYEWGLKAGRSPCIVHFAGPWKPWAHPSHSFAKTYQLALEPLSELPFQVQRASPELLHTNIRRQRNLRLKMNTIFRHRRYRRQRLFDALSQSAAIP